MDVPTLREIRRLPTASATKQDATGPAPNRRSNWTAAHGVAFAIGIPLMLISLGWLGYNGWIKSRVNVSAPTVEQLLQASPDTLNKVDFENISLVDSYEKIWKPLSVLKLSTRPTPIYVHHRNFVEGLNTKMSIAAGLGLFGLLASGWALFASRS